MIENMIWAEKYRPRTIEECILPESIKAQARGLVESNNFTSLMFTGTAGVGKTTLARAIANEIGADFMQINASSEGNIDYIRNELSRFSKTVSMTGDKKITLLDEADGLTAVAQQALRGFMEETSHNHAIIFTCNYSAKIIEPIKSRCSVIDFKFPKTDKTLLATQFAKRVLSILDTEKVEYDKRSVLELIMKKFPDFRSVLNTLQGYSAGGKIDAGVLLDMSDEVVMVLINALKEKKFNDVRKWVAENSDIESVQMFREFYDRASMLLQPKSIPELILLLGEYSYKDAFVIDKEINRMAFLTSILLSDTILWK